MNDRPRRTSPDDPPDAMDPWLRETMGSESGAVSDCLDPDVLAAWAEGALSTSERSFAEAHAARCARCQAMLAVMARTVPSEPAPARFPFRKGLLIFTPAAAAALAVALWFAVEPRRDPLPTAAPPPPTAARDNQLAASAAPSSTPAEAAADKKVAQPEAAAAGDRESERKVPARADVSNQRATTLLDELKKQEAKVKEKDSAAPGGVAETVTVVSQSPPVQTSQQQRAQTAEETRALFRSAQQQTTQQQPTSPQQGQTQLPAPQQQSDAAARQRSADPTPTPPGSPPPPAAAASAPAAKPSADAVANERADRAEQFGTRTGAGGAGLGRVSTANDALKVSALFSVAVAAAPDGKTRWRIADRFVQQSPDGGTTWSTQYTLDEGTQLVSGVAPSPTVCWIVGRSGAIVTTSDGVTWRRVTFPFNVDLVAVTSADARTATVVTADKRVFVTTDGGARWMAK
jgi:hypothetical protein